MDLNGWMKDLIAGMILVAIISYVFMDGGKTFKEVMGGFTDFFTKSTNALKAPGN
jgi:Flp pilus assembly pilin Flp